MNKIHILIMNKFSLVINLKQIMEDMGKKHYLVLNKTIKIAENIKFEKIIIKFYF